MIIGGASSDAPPATFLCLCLGGSKGSSTTFEIWTILWIPEFVLDVGVYRTKLSFSTFLRAAEQRKAGLLFLSLLTPSC